MAAVPGGLRELIEVGLGRRPAELVVRGGTVVDVFTASLIEADVLIYGGRVVALTRPGEGEGARVIDARGGYVAPGLMDAHTHIESTMLAPPRLAEALVPRGVTALFIDPHEVANVLGVEGIDILVSLAEGVPLRLFVEVPSRVPTAPGLETSGAYLGPEEVAELLRRPYAASLGELNWQNLLSGREEYLLKVAEALRLGKRVNGHLAGLGGRGLDAAVAAGLMDDHEAVSFGEALERVRRGCAVMIREGTSERNLDAIVGGILDAGLKDLSSFMFCTDDKHPADIVREGHIDYNVRRAVELGMDPVKAIQLATINIARYFRLDHILGSVAPGRLADIVILEDLEQFRVRSVIFGGEPVYADGKLLWGPPKEVRVPEHALRTVRVSEELTPEDLLVRAPGTCVRARVRVMGVVPDQIVVEALEAVLPVVGRYVSADPERDIAHIAVVDRHKGSKSVGKAFIKGFGIGRGAIASTVAHDHHNAVVVGANPEDMLAAVRHLARMGGGFAAVVDGEVVADLPLPFAGLMSLEPLEAVVEGLDRVNRAAREVLGSSLRAPFMQLEFVTLPTVPEYGLTDKGLIDSRRYVVVDPVIECLEEAPGQVGE